MSARSAAAALASGKGHTDENFPVASRLLRPEHRPAVMAFYRFARAADDVADNPSAEPCAKLALLDGLATTLGGGSDSEPTALALRRAAPAAGPEHGLDLLEAFRRDVTKLRYASWEELIDYCRFSAAPVGRFVLDVHSEARTLWPANDALCSALQIINHLQDCGKDYRELGRVYLPGDVLRAEGARVEDLARSRATPALRGAIARLAQRTQLLLEASRPFARGIRDRRLGAEVAAIQRLAEDLARMLRERDPLCERVHHSRPEALALAAGAALRRLTGL